MTDDEAEIRTLVDGWVRALAAKDVEARTTAYARDVVIFDVVNPHQRVGLDALRERLADWMASFEGPIGCEVRDLTIVAGDGVGFVHSLNRFHGTLAAGGRLDMWVRFTACLRRVDGAWTVTHEHASVPFDVETGQASVGLAP